MRHRLFSLLALLLMLGASSAWTLGYEPPSCAQQYSLLGANFTVQQYGSALACAANANQLYGMSFAAANGPGDGNTWSITEGGTGYYKCTAGQCGIFASGGTVSFMLRSQSAGGSPKAFLTGYMPLPLSGSCNWTISAACTYGWNLELNDTPMQSAAAATGAFTELNSTHYNITSSIGSSFIVPKAQGSVKIRMLCAPYYSTTETQTFTITCANYTIAAANTAAPMNTAPSYLGVNRLSMQNAYVSATAGGIVRSDFATVDSNVPNTGEYCQGLLLYGSSVLLPKITYIPSTDAFAYFYNGTSSVAYLKNNTVNYVLDASTNLWYIVPAFSCTSYSTVYTVGAYIYTTGSSGGTGLTAPVVPLLLSCKQNGSQYAILSNFGTAVTHTTYYGNSTTFLVDTASGTGYSFAVNTTKYPNVNYTANGITYCSKGAGTSLIPGITAFSGIDTGAFKPFLLIIWIVGVAVTILVPFAIVFPILLNDIFVIVSTQTMAYIAVVAVVVSAMAQYRQQMSLKGAIVYIALGFGIISLYYSYTSLSYTGVTAAFASMSAAIGQGDFAAFVGSAPNFIISFFTFIFSLPTLFVQIIAQIVALLSPELATAVGAISGFLSVGIALVIVIKGYEIIANRFRSV